jgi:hypothetical protein
LKDSLDRLEDIDGHVVVITTDSATRNYLMTLKLQSTLEDSGIEWPALTSHTPWMVHVIQIGLGAFLSSLGVKSRTKSWEAQKRDQHWK